MTRTNYDHKHCAHQVTQVHIEEADGAFTEISKGLTELFRTLDIAKTESNFLSNCIMSKLNATREQIGEKSGKLHKAVNLTEDALEEIHAALSGLARLLDEAGYEVNVPAANIAALITPHLRTISAVREMLQGAAR